MLPAVNYDESVVSNILGLDGKEFSPNMTAAERAATFVPPYAPRIHLNMHRPLWGLGLLRARLQRDFGLEPGSVESNTKVVYFSASVSNEGAEGGIEHLLLCTTIGAAMTTAVGGETQLECYLRTITSARPAVASPPKKRAKFQGPKLDFYQSGLQTMQERCVDDFCTQPSEPGGEPKYRVRDAVRVLGEASTILGSLRSLRHLPSPEV